MEIFYALLGISVVVGALYFFFKVLPDRATDRLFLSHLQVELNSKSRADIDPVVVAKEVASKPNFSFSILEKETYLEPGYIGVEKVLKIKLLNRSNKERSYSLEKINSKWY